MRWQYISLEVHASMMWAGGKINADGMTEHLNRLGADGWEIACCFETNAYEGRTRSVFLVLKRPVPAPGASVGS